MKVFKWLSAMDCTRYVDGVRSGSCRAESRAGCVPEVKTIMYDEVPHSGVATSRDDEEIV